MQRQIINTKNLLLRLYTVRAGHHWTSLTFVLSIQTVTVPTYVPRLSHLCALSAWVPLVLYLTSSPAEWWQQPPSLSISRSPHSPPPRCPHHVSHVPWCHCFLKLCFILLWICVLSPLPAKWNQIPFGIQRPWKSSSTIMFDFILHDYWVRTFCYSHFRQPKLRRSVNSDLPWCLYSGHFSCLKSRIQHCLHFKTRVYICMYH